MQKQSYYHFDNSVYQQPEQLELKLIFEGSRHARRKLTDTLQEFVEYARASGSKRCQWYYSTCTKMIYSALGFTPGSRKENMKSAQLSQLIMAEDVVSQALSDAMNRKLYYKRCFQYAREQLKIYLFNQSEFIRCKRN